MRRPARAGGRGRWRTVTWLGLAWLGVGALSLGGCAASPSTTPTTARPATTTSTGPAPAPGTLRFSAPTPVTSGTPLAAVSCRTAQSCVALDTSGRAYAYDGSGWAAPQPASGPPLGPGGLDVSCAGAGACQAITTAADTVTSWDGQTWSMPVPLPGATGLGAVGCGPGGYCAAVDSEGDAFALSSDGWRATAGDWGSVSSISCVDPTFCMSVSGGISHWDGSQWTTPDPQSATSSLTGVSCPTTASCTAVDQGGQALTWNGQAWGPAVRIEPGSVSADASGVPLTGISCPTVGFCVAADGGGGVLQWSGGAWARTSVDGSRPVTAVSCPTATFCVAVDQDGRAVIGRTG